MVKSVLIAAITVLASPTCADITLLANEDYAVQVGNVSVRADEDANRTTISAPQTPSWTVPASPRLFGVSPSGNAILAIHEGSHIEKIETFLFIATLYRRDGDSFTFRHLGLSSFGLSNDLPRDDRGLRWLDDFETVDDAWILTLSNGKTATIPFN